MKKIIASAAIGVAALGTGIGFASAAGAQTTACTTAASGNCGAQVNVNNNALAVIAPAKNVGVGATPLDSTFTQDFNAVQTTSNNNERVFFYAPNGVQTKWVISNTSGKTVALRAFNPSSNFQRWTGVNTRNTSGTQWTNRASGNKLMATGTGNRVVAMANPTNVNGSYWGFQAAAVIPAP